MFKDPQQDQDFFYRLNFGSSKKDVMTAFEWFTKYKLLPMLDSIPQDLNAWEMFYAVSPNFVLQSSGALFAGSTPLVEGIMLRMVDGSTHFWSAGDDKMYTSRHEWRENCTSPANQTVKEFVQFTTMNYRKESDAEYFVKMAASTALNMVEQMGLVSGDPREVFKYFYQSCRERQVDVRSSLDQLTKELVNDYKRAKVAGTI